MSGSPRSVKRLQASMSAKVTSTGGASAMRPWIHAWKMNVSLGHGEIASLRLMRRCAPATAS